MDSVLQIIVSVVSFVYIAFFTVLQFVVDAWHVVLLFAFVIVIVVFNIRRKMTRTRSPAADR